MRKDRQPRVGATHRGWTRVARTGHIICLCFKTCLFPLCEQSLEEEGLRRAQEVSEASNRRSSLNADKAGMSRSVIISLCSVTTEEKNYISYWLLHTPKEGAVYFKYGYSHWSYICYHRKIIPLFASSLFLSTFHYWWMLSQSEFASRFPQPLPLGFLLPYMFDVQQRLLD